MVPFWKPSPIRDLAETTVSCRVTEALSGKDMQNSDASYLKTPTFCLDSSHLGTWFILASCWESATAQVSDDASDKAVARASCCAGSEERLLELKPNGFEDLCGLDKTRVRVSTSCMLWPARSLSSTRCIGSGAVAPGPSTGSCS